MLAYWTLPPQVFPWYKRPCLFRMQNYFCYQFYILSHSVVLQLASEAVAERLLPHNEGPFFSVNYVHKFISFAVFYKRAVFFLESYPYFYVRFMTQSLISLWIMSKFFKYFFKAVLFLFVNKIHNYFLIYGLLWRGCMFSSWIMPLLKRQFFLCESCP